MLIYNADYNVFFEITVYARSYDLGGAVFEFFDYLFIYFFGMRSNNQKFIRRLTALNKSVAYKTRHKAIQQAQTRGFVTIFSAVGVNENGNDRNHCVQRKRNVKEIKFGFFLAYEL